MKQELSRLIYLSRLKQIKKNLGSKCTFLSNVRTSDGSRLVRVVLLENSKKETYNFEVPYDLTSITSADYDYLEQSILSKFNKNVVKGN